VLFRYRPLHPRKRPIAYFPAEEPDIRRPGPENVMRQSIAVFALICLILTGCASAQSPALTLPDFGPLRDKASDSVDITLGSFALFLGRHFIDDSVPDSAAVRELLKGMRSVRVRHYEFDDDFAYSKSDLDGVRAQLSTRGWSRLVQVRDRKNSQDVDVYVALDKDKITALTLVTSEPREFTIVNIDGDLDSEQIAAFRAKLEADHFDHSHSIASDADEGSEPL
jgi:hypothetical protein